MISIHDWLRMKEATGEPVTSDEPQDPNEEDWAYYHTKIQGNAKKYLDWFLEEIEGKKLSLVRKGFIVQEIMDALGMTVGQYVRITSNIRHALQRREKMGAQDVGANPAAGTQPAPAVAQNPGANPAAGTQTPPAAPQNPGANPAAGGWSVPKNPDPNAARTNPAVNKPPYQQPPQKKWAV